MSAVRPAHTFHQKRNRQRSGADTEQLVEQTQCIPHRPAGQTSQMNQQVFFIVNLLLLKNLAQLGDNGLRSHRRKVKPLTAGLNSRQDFIGFGRGKDEFHMRRRFLQNLQQRIERIRGEHVNFIDDIDFKSSPGRQINRIGNQLPHMLHLIVGGAVDFDYINILAGMNGLAAVARKARVNSRLFGFETIQRFGQNPRHGRLADAARAGKQISVGDSPRENRIFQRLRNGILTDNIIEGLRTVASCQNRICHCCLSSWESPPAFYKNQKRWSGLPHTAPLPLRAARFPA